MLDHRFQKLLWNFASVANVINPFLYAMYDYGPAIGCRMTNYGNDQKLQEGSQEINKMEVKQGKVMFRLTKLS